MKKKLLSAVLVTTMLFLSACNSTASSTTKANNEPGKPEAETSADASETTKTSESDKGATPDPAGKYTYTIYAGTEYETTLSMDVNIDDYITEKPNLSTPFFSYALLAEDLGWLPNGDKNSDKQPYFYSYPYGDTQMVWRNADGAYPNANNPSGYPQIYGFDYHLAPISNYEASARTTEEIATSHLNYGIIVQFRQHPDAICYHTVQNSSRVGVSKDDVIIMAYVLSSAITRPGENPFVGTNLEKAQSMNSDKYLTYTLP